MNRREVLKKISIITAGVIATPTLINIFYACKESQGSEDFEFFSKKSFKLITSLVDCILPKSNTKGGVELNVPLFIDRVIYQTVSKESKRIIEKGLNLFNKRIKSTRRGDVELALNSYLTISSEEEKSVFKLVQKNYNEVSSEEKDKYLVYNFLLKIRYYALLSFFTSEEIMKEHLGYESIPGYYNGCVD